MLHSPRQGEKKNNWNLPPAKRTPWISSYHPRSALVTGARLKVLIYGTPIVTLVRVSAFTAQWPQRERPVRMAKICGLLSGVWKWHTADCNISPCTSGWGFCWRVFYECDYEINLKWDEKAHTHTHTANRCWWCHLHTLSMSRVCVDSRDSVTVFTTLTYTSV